MGREIKSPGDRKSRGLLALGGEQTLTANFADTETDAFQVVAYGRVGFRLDVTFNGSDVEVEAQSSADGEEWWPLARPVHLAPGGATRIEPEIMEIRSLDWPEPAKVPLPDLDVSTARWVRLRLRGAGAVVTVRAAAGR